MYPDAEFHRSLNRHLTAGVLPGQFDLDAMRLDELRRQAARPPRTEGPQSRARVGRAAGIFRAIARLLHPGTQVVRQ